MTKSQVKEEPVQEQTGLAGTAMRGAMVMVALRFTLRAIGLVSVVIMARLLSPADFGVVGTAALVTGIFAILQNTGIGDGLSRLQHLSRSQVDTAWTIALLAALMVALLLVATAPLAAELLREPRLIAIMPWIALAPVITALGSPGSNLLMRKFAFGQEFRLRTAQKVINVAATVACALWFRDYRGLIAGGLFGAISSVALTYILFPTIPRLNLVHWRYFIGFSGWTMVQATANYVTSSIDEILVRRITGAADFGRYHTSRDLSRVFVSEMVAPASAALLPTMARMVGERARFARACEHAIAVAMLVAAGVSSVVSAGAPHLVRLLLGDQWSGSATYLSVLAIGAAATATAELHRGVLAARGDARISAALWVIRALVLTVVCIIATAWGATPYSIALVFSAAALALLFIDYAYIFRRIGAPNGAFARAFMRPVVAAAVTLACFKAMPAPSTGWIVIDAALQLGGAALLYASTVLLAWKCSGCPDGGERALMQRVRLPGWLGRWASPQGSA